VKEINDLSVRDASDFRRVHAPDTSANFRADKENSRTVFRVPTRVRVDGFVSGARIVVWNVQHWQALVPSPFHREISERYSVAYFSYGRIFFPTRKTRINLTLPSFAERVNSNHR